MNVQNNLKTLNNVTDKLSNCIDDIISGKLSIKKAIEINKLARNSINATKEGVMIAHHQQIQRDKIIMHQKEIDVKKEHIQLQRDKFLTN
jgi:tRNA uridine 5-carbamoylmethylation protein Kti12